ncbi:metal ABC transporter permease [Microbacterium aquimaris]|uniref:Metal ABC transporter permease n=1 Tax=Microbacterium aquimaris TaxID=459816 RepID=A0ABU5N9G1_9MICO|nr:metal ABC transporter permease [Microbacterium aquimaris]MDZ8162723.1 metal ABC transporter permease [Microbacterium aquimaris]
MHLFDPFAYPFMTTALAAMILISLAAGPISTLVNLRGLEFMSDGLIHAAFPGIVIGYVVGGTEGLYPGAVVTTVLAAVVLTLLTRRKVSSDAATATVLTSAFGIGVIIVSRKSDYAGQLQELLFGRLFTVQPSELLPLGVTLVLALALVAVTWRRQVFRAFDAAGATAAGGRVLLTDLALTIAIALVVVAASNTVGNLLVLAILMLPGAAGRLISRRIEWIVLTAIVFTVLAAWWGLWAAFSISLSASSLLPGGATVVLTMTIGYLALVTVRILLDGWARHRAVRT